VADLDRHHEEATLEVVGQAAEQESQMLVLEELQDKERQVKEMQAGQGQVTHAEVVEEQVQ
jgi:hypothetical protein